MTDNQRNALKVAFSWHGMMVEKLNQTDAQRKADGGCTWQDCREYRNDMLALAGVPGLLDRK